MANEFAHLHVHTDFSLLDGACKIPLLADLCQEWGMPGMACTDHGTMAGTMAMYEEFTGQGLTAGIGCEFYVAPGALSEKKPKEQRFHLVMLAKDADGYRSLCELNRIAWHDGFYYRPRIDLETLAAHSKGCMALTACIAGQLPRAIQEGDDAKVRKVLGAYMDIFGKDDLYLEMQDHGIPEEQVTNAGLVALAREHGLKLVATNDAHYLKKEHAKAHEVLLCVGTQKTLDDPNHFTFSGPDYYVTSPDEMYEKFSEVPEACSNTVEVIEKCQFDYPIGKNVKSHYPVYEIQGDNTDVGREKALRVLCRQGMIERYGFDTEGESLTEDQQAKVDRMNYEIGVIKDMGFLSYFLVVADFIRYARTIGVAVGPGRGSGAGSIVSYAMHITDLCPIEYGLLFERFLNPDRVSPPDFDIDFCERRRHEVISYVREKYGADQVCQIGTLGTMKCKAALKDVARVLGVEPSEAARLVKPIPTDPKMTIAKALKNVPEFKKMVESEPWAEKVVEFAKVLEGLNRNQSIHACGVIICDEELTGVVPLARGSSEEMITQFPAGPCEDLGLLKMDFLGLKTLTIIEDAIEMVRENRGVELDQTTWPLDDKKTYEMLRGGKSVGVFQLESEGMQKWCRKLGLNNIQDIIALCALYRPGPMEFIPTFVACKQGREQPEYETPEMKRILGETYGIMVYQEQIMQVVQAVAGFSLAQADIMRRAIGKKKEKEMAAQSVRFKEGCLKLGHSQEIADSIWEKILKFAEYGFNKSHSAAYGLLSFRTAYLKANYSAEFMSAVLTSELSTAEKVSFYLAECADMGLTVAAPDVNGSALQFGVDGDIIRFGLAAIKGMGESAAEAVIKARKEGGSFADLLDFCERVGDKVNKRVMESLCKAGAFDCFGHRRAQIMDMIEPTVSLAQQTLRDKAVGQGSLFDFLDDDDSAVNPNKIPPPDVPEWDMPQLLAYEKELLGFYVTGHPLDSCMDEIRCYQTDGLAAVPMLEDNMGLRVGAFLTGIVIRYAKKDNRPWAILQLEGRESSMEALLFSDAYESCGALLEADMPVIVEGHVSKRDDEPVKIIATKVYTLDMAPIDLTSEVHVHMREGQATTESLQRFANACSEFPGEAVLVLAAICDDHRTAFVESSMRVANTAGLRQLVESTFGPESFRSKSLQTRPEPRQRRTFGRRPNRND